MARHQCRSIYSGVLLLLLIVFLISSYKSTRPTAIFDTHEHIQSVHQADMLLAANNTLGIRKTILLPTPTETLTLNGRSSYTGYKENTEELFKIAKKYPDHFIPLCTASPLDPNAAEYLDSCIKLGGKGIKLYNGHSYYHGIFNMPLDSPRMMPMYSYAVQNRLPLLYHINIVNYGRELEKVMEAYPEMTISVPHFMVSSVDLDKVGALLDKYPNMFTDISFGSPEFMAAGFRRISKDPDKYLKFFNKYQDRILFGADMVLTDSTAKDQAYMEETLTCYKDLLEKRRFSCAPVSLFYEQALMTSQSALDNCKPKTGDYCKNLEQKANIHQQRLEEVTTLNGLGLSDSVLGKVYWENAKRFLGTY